MIKISVAIIAKNEEACLARMLETVKWADEIVVSDTGSKDKTVEIAKKYTDKVYTEYKWEDSFAKARNYVLSKCTGDWVISIDCDERLMTPEKEVRQIIEKADKAGFRTLNIKVVSEDGKGTNAFPRIFKRVKEVFWLGNAHNYLSVSEKNKSDIEIRYGYSKAHKLDPDRTLRILLKSVQENPKKPREIYYLAREYWSRRDYIRAVYWLDEYLKVATWLPEKADGFLMAARSWWALRNGETARNYCMRAIQINANFKEALNFMAEISWEKNALAWRKFSEIADNTDVLFIRNLKDNLPADETIEVCFLVYQRPERVLLILKQLSAQTIQNFKVNIWNNSGQPLDISGFPADRISIIESKENVGSQARFKLAKLTKGNPIIFFDDDEDLHPNFVEYHYRQYLKFGKDCILGYFTRVFDKESYWKSIGSNYGEEVDYVATKSMIFNRAILDKEDSLQDIPEDFVKVEDLYLCYIARMKYGIKLIKIDPASHPMIDNKDQYIKLLEYKEQAFRKLREKGWRLLIDGVKRFGKFFFKTRRGVWDEQILAGEINPSYYRMPDNPKVVVDIGAHIGGTAVLAGSLGAEVYAYEPEEDNFKLLLENVKLNNLAGKVHCFNKAVGKGKKRKLYLTGNNSGMGSLIDGTDKSSEVEMIGIKKVFKDIEHCDLLKIDCEGAEYEFLRDVPFEKVDRISLELHKGKQKEMLEFLSQFYKVESQPAVDRTSLMVFCEKL